MGKGNLSKFVGKGDICLETNNGTRLILRNVRNILDIHLNLIFRRKLDDASLCNTFTNG